MLSGGPFLLKSACPIGAAGGAVAASQPGWSDAIPGTKMAGRHQATHPFVIDGAAADGPNL